ncbi:MAG: hypothetical protein ACKVP3_24180 [Hyphomicrobiaceae bacterium]
MSNGGEYDWDFLSQREADFVTQAIAALGELPWAQPLLQAIEQKGGITGANKALLFEARFAYALRQAGMAPQYEVAGEAQSTIDFGFTSGQQGWLVELMRLEETEAAQAATTAEVDEGGFEWFRRLLTTNAADARQSEEGETLKAVERICQKCERDGQPHKFPAPTGRYHALLVDFRTFLHGGDVQDRIHVGLGGRYVKGPWYQRFWKNRLISGVYSAETTLRGSAQCRERVHFLGFVNETAYEDGAFRAATQFIANPHLFANVQAMRDAIATWPVQPAQVINNK